MRVVRRNTIKATPQRWWQGALGTYDKGWPVDAAVLSLVYDRWTLHGHWLDGEVVPYDMGDLEFQDPQEAFDFALKAGVPVLDQDGRILVEPLREHPERIPLHVWRQAHLCEQLRAIDEHIEQHPTNFHLRAWKESLLQRWHRLVHAIPPNHRIVR